MRPRAATLGLSAALAGFAAACHAQPGAEWDFVVRLDDRPIGTHRFVLSPGDAGTLAIASDAQFEVKVLGWTAYRYRHRAHERWTGDCLAALDASTDDDGRRTQVRARRADGAFRIEVDPPPDHAPATSAGSCLMSFAYWNTRLPAQQRLLDPGTGRVVPVQVQPLPPAAIDTRRGPVSARGWRIAGLPNPIDVWYAGSEWIGLDTVVGGRRLTYRLR